MKQDAPVQEPRQPTPGQEHKRISPFDPHIWMWLVVLFTAYYVFVNQASTSPDLVAYSDFKQSVERGDVATVTFKGDQIHGSYAAAGEDKGKGFVTVVPGIPDSSLLPLLEEKHVEIEAQTTAEPQWLQLLLGLLPWLFIAAFFIYSAGVLQQRMGGGGGLFGFAKSRARLFEHKDNDVTYDDVAGLESAKRDLAETIEFLRSP